MKNKQKFIHLVDLGFHIKLLQNNENDSLLSYFDESFYIIYFYYGS